MVDHEFEAMAADANILPDGTCSIMFHTSAGLVVVRGQRPVLQQLFESAKDALEAPPKTFPKL